MAEQTIALTEQLKKLSEEFQSVNDQIKEMLELFGQVSQSGAAAMRSMASQSRAADQALRSLSSTMKNMTGTSSVIGAANTSAALGALTGGGGGPSGGGPSQVAGTGAPANQQLVSAILNPLSQGLPQIAGALGRGAGRIAGAAASPLRKIPFLGRIIGAAADIAPDLFGAAAAMGTSATIAAGQQIVGDATNLRLGMEETGFYMQRNRRDKVEAGARTALNYGISPIQFMGLGASANLAVGRGQGQLPELFAQAGSRGALRVDPSSFMPLASTLAAGNADVVATMQSLLGTLNRESFVGREDTSRDTRNILDAVNQLVGMQVGATGRLRGDEGARGALGITRALSGAFGGPFDSSQAGRVAQALLSTAMSPGGGEGGQIAMLQAFGFGNPNMDALNRMSEAFGGPGNFQRTSYITARMMQERALEEGGIERLLAFVRTAAGGNIQQQSMLLSNISGGRVGINQAMDVLSAPGLSAQMRQGLADKFGLTVDQGKQALSGLPITQEQLALTGIQLDIDKGQLVKILAANRQLTEAMGKLTAEALPGLVKSFQGFVSVSRFLLDTTASTLISTKKAMRAAGLIK